MVVQSWVARLVGQGEDLRQRRAAEAQRQLEISEQLAREAPPFWARFLDELRDRLDEFGRLTAVPFDTGHPTAQRLAAKQPGGAQVVAEWMPEEAPGGTVTLVLPGGIVISHCPIVIGARGMPVFRGENGVEFDGPGAAEVLLTPCFRVLLDLPDPVPDAGRLIGFRRTTRGPS